MRSRGECNCPCHRVPSMRHIIACCSGSPFRFDPQELKDLVENVVSDAVRDTDDAIEKKRQQALQRDIEQRANISTEKGTDEKEVERELSDDPLNTGAPKRAAPGIDPQQAAPAASPQAPQQGPQGPIDADAIIDKFNIIRSGRSLNDRDIRDMMKQYLGSLTPGQMQATFGILQKIAGIVQPAVPPRTQAPPQEPSAITNARLQMLQQKQAGEKQQQAQPPQASAPAAAPPPRAAKPPPDEEEEERDLPPIRVGPRESVTRPKLLIQE